VGELKERGFERITVKYMRENWDMGGDLIEVMAERAAEADHIHPDFEILRGKQNQLWARPKP
jgi:hypothetical protein